MVISMADNVNPEKIRKIWTIIKQVVEIILAALAGAAVGSCHAAVRLFAQVLPF